MTAGPRRNFQTVLALACVLTAASVAVKGPALEPADKIVVIKSSHTLMLLRGGKVIKEYKVALGNDPYGPKTRQGDGKTPEGDYTIDAKNAHSRFHLALHISYPSAADRERARKMGAAPGGEIMIHGLPSEWAWLGSLHRRHDWTAGCIAVTNAEIEEIWAMVPVGTPIEVKP